MNDEEISEVQQALLKSYPPKDLVGVNAQSIEVTGCYILLALEKSNEILEGIRIELKKHNK